MARYNPNMPSAEDRAIDRFCDLLIEKLHSLQADWKKPWLSASSQQYPRNLSGRPYAGNNALMLMFNAEKEGYTMPFYATFNRITALNFTGYPNGFEDLTHGQARFLSIKSNAEIVLNSLTSYYDSERSSGIRR